MSHLTVSSLATAAVWSTLSTQGFAADAAVAPGPASVVLQTVEVVATTPLPGSGVDIDTVPGNVQTLSTRQLEGDGASALLPAAAQRQLGSVNLNDAPGSQFQPDFVYRGFEASPVSGIAQGLAVYQQGVRINEAFGDTVNWDLVPQFAVRRLTVQSNNPVFGLNALGGAVSLEMKDGFNSRGTELQLSGGSYGNVNGSGEQSLRLGSLAFYGAVGGLEDDGYRDHQPTALHQLYADAGYENGPAELHFSVTAADNNIGALGPTPVQMLQQDRRAVFTFPQGTHDEMGLLQLRGNYQLGDRQQLGASLYWRRFRQRLIDGNTTDAQACGNNAGFFCLEGNGNFPGDALYDASGRQVPTSVLPAGATPGEIDHTATGSSSEGLTLQWTDAGPLGRLDNHLVIGAAYDHGGTAYAARGELGFIEPDLQVDGAGVIIDQANSTTAQPPLEEPVSVRATNAYYGVYATDTMELTPALAATLGLRYNLADIRLDDELGSSLDGRHRYNRVNPGAGLTYRFGRQLTAYGGYSEANRAPTPAELSCANPASPCLLDAFLVSDPELHQVVSRTWEAGLRGHFAAASLPGHFAWNLGVFRTSSSNDIILLGTQINGFGYYDNAGTTRRQGVEAGMSYHSERWDVSVSYSLIDATFRDPETLSSNSPAADANGFISVQPGDQLPMTPRQRVTLNAELAVTRRWKLGGDLRTVSGQYLVGDESNQEPKLPGYTVVGFSSSYQLLQSLRVFVEIDNLFDRNYDTYGTFAQLNGLPPNINLTDPRTLSPAPGRLVYAGAHLSL